jgi:hypothetical protein
MSGFGCGSAALGSSWLRGEPIDFGFAFRIQQRCLCPLNMTITLETRVVRSNEPVSAATGDALVMFSVEKGSYYGLNDIATAIWQRIKSPIAVAALCANLQEAFDVTPERCETEVLSFLRKLEAKGLVQAVD